MSSRPMALPSLSGLALRAHAPAHTGVGEERKRAREDACAALRAQFAALNQTLFDVSGSTENIVSALTNALRDTTTILSDSNSDWDDKTIVCVFKVVMEHLGVVVYAAKRFSSTNSEEKTMSYEALKLLSHVATHCNRAEAGRLETAGCVTIGIRALRQRAVSEAFPLEAVVSLLTMVATDTLLWVEDMMNGIDVLWELVKDEDTDFKVRTNAIQILELIVIAGDEYNGKFRVYEHGNLKMWKLYMEVLDDTKRPVAHIGPHGCNAVARTLADPKKMRALLEAHPNVYDAVARMREDAKSCWSYFDDKIKAAIDAMLGSRGYQTVAALSSHAPSLVAAIALAKTLHGEAEAAIHDYQALFESSSLAPQAQDLVAATVRQAAKRGELEKMRASEAECQTHLARVAASKGVEGAVLEEAGHALVLNVHKAVEKVYEGYERVMGILEVVHRLQAAHDPNPLGEAPNEDVERLREELFATETLATSETSPFSAHETNRLARMRPNQ